MKNQLLLAFLCVVAVGPVAGQTCGPATGELRVTGWPITGGDDVRRLPDGRIASPVFNAYSQGPLSKLYIRRRIAGDCPSCGVGAHEDLSYMTAPELTAKDLAALRSVRWRFYKPCAVQKVKVPPELYRILRETRPGTLASVRLDPAFVGSGRSVASAPVLAKRQAVREKRVAALVAAARPARARTFPWWGVLGSFLLLCSGVGLLGHVQRQKNQDRRRHARLLVQRADLARRAALSDASSPKG